MVNCVRVNFEQDVEMLKLSFIESLIVECNIKASLRNLLLAGLLLLLILAGIYTSFSFSHSLLSDIDVPSF